MKKNLTFLMRVFASAVFLLTMLLLSTGPVSATTVSYEFGDLNSALIYTESTYSVIETVQFEITNSTGYTWTDFHVALDGSYLGAGYDYMRFADIGGDGIYHGSGTASFSDVNADSYGYNEVMTIDLITIAHGATFNFSADIVGGVFPEGLDTYRIYAQPSIDGNNPPPPAVPEPTTMVLLGAGILGFAGVSRKKTA